MELITTTIKRKGKRSVRRHLFITTVRTTPEALLRLIRQRWSIENEWHWVRDTQLDEDAHRYANRIGAPVFSLLRPVVMNLLRRGGYRSIRRGLRTLSHDIKGMLRLGGVQLAKTAPESTFRQPCFSDQLAGAELFDLLGDGDDLTDLEVGPAISSRIKGQQLHQVHMALAVLQ